MVLSLEDKIKAVAAYFISGYGYSAIKFQSENESTRINRMNEDCYLSSFLPSSKYQLIRITGKSIKEFSSDEGDIKSLIEEFSKATSYMGLNHKPIAFLDIHINTEAYDVNLSPYDYINMDVDYIAGVDLRNDYPNLGDCFKEKSIKKNFKKPNSFSLLKKMITPGTLTVVLICLFVFIIDTILSYFFNQSVAYIITGALYNTFTVGLKQVWRLLTYGFTHGGFIHLFCNMYSLFSIGVIFERLFSTKSFFITSFISLLLGGLAQSILAPNGLTVGFSGALYGLLVFYFMFQIENKSFNLRANMPLIIINLALNFLSTTAWLGHLGGAIGGLLAYLILRKEGNNRSFALIFLVVVVALLFFRLYYNPTISPLFIGTDNQVINAFKQMGLNNYSNNLANRLLEVYSKLGGLK